MSLFFSLIFNILLTAVGVMIAGGLPYFMGADASIAPGASAYFLVVMLFFPVRGILFLSGGKNVSGVQEFGLSQNESYIKMKVL